MKKGEVLEAPKEKNHTKPPTLMLGGIVNGGMYKMCMGCKKHGSGCGTCVEIKQNTEV